jgi:ribosome-binding protein aMBF1 (putative translation factor)
VDFLSAQARLDSSLGIRAILLPVAGNPKVTHEPSLIVRQQKASALFLSSPLKNELRFVFVESNSEANSVDVNISHEDDGVVSAKPSPPATLPNPDDLRGVLAYWIRLKRVEKGWSQERLAMECELDRTYVSAVERSRWNVSLSNIERLALALEVPAWALLKPPETKNAEMDSPTAGSAGFGFRRARCV